MIRRVYRKLRCYARDERGAETLQVLMLIAIAAVCLILVKLWANWYFEYTRTAIDILVEN